jgi:hypothetical protein
MTRNLTSQIGRFALTLFIIVLGTSCNFENSVDPPGDVANFNPTEAYPKVRDYVGKKAKLIEINARYVRSDGTMDLTADYKPSLTYQFVQKSSASENKPVGTGTKGREYEGIEVNVSAPHWVSQSINGRAPQSKKNKGMVKRVSSAGKHKWEERAKKPKCSFERIWKKAMKVDKDTKKARDAVAVIDYNKKGYSFVINDLNVRLFFDHKCQVDEDRRF